MENKNDKRNQPKTIKGLNDAMLVVGIKSWIAAASILILIGAALIWAFFGKMYLKEDASGVLVRSGRVVNIYSAEDSVILDLTIKLNQYVEADQTIAFLDQSELVGDINSMIAANSSELEIEAARNALLSRSKIQSDVSGRVTNVYVRVGDYIEKGTKIATISVGAEKSKSLECLLFVPMSKMKEIKKGMSVNIYPDFAGKEEYGSMIGRVSSISEYPITKQYLFDVIGNEELAETFSKNDTFYEVSVNLVTSTDTYTGYEWTISYGPHKDIGNLSLCDAEITVGELRPIDVFF